jgi:hypothetical protein
MTVENIYLYCSFILLFDPLILFFFIFFFINGGYRDPNFPKIFLIPKFLYISQGSDKAIRFIIIELLVSCSFYHVLVFFLGQWHH